MTKRIYVRISTDMQESLRQVDILNNNGYTKDNAIWYEEIYSGKTKNRPVLIKLMKELEKDDIVVITDLSRLARSVKDLWQLSDEIVIKKATLISLKENIDLSTSTGRLVFSMLGAIYQFERDTLSDRTKEALRAKKNSGVVLGRPKTISDDVIVNAVNEYLSNIENGHKQSYIEVAKNYRISHVSLFNAVKKEKKNVKETN